MIIHRISGQKTKTLLEFYKPHDGQTERAHVAHSGMVELLLHLFTIEGPELFAFTSHHSLCFVDGDSHTNPLIARIALGCTADGDETLLPLYHIGYPPTPEVLRNHTEWICETTGRIGHAGELLTAAFRDSAFSPLA